jgi:hypothetical protein
LINERRALTRQIQAMFHEHLLGVYRWDQAVILSPRLVEKKPGRDREAGKYHDQIIMQIGPFDIEVSGPDEHPPCGQVMVKFGILFQDGPLDATTWAKVAEFIKKHKPEEDNVEDEFTARDDWGRGGRNAWGSRNP